MIDITIPAGTLKEVIKILIGIENEFRVSFTQDELKILAVDPANCALISLKMDKTAFIKYEVSDNIDIGLDLQRLNTIIGPASKISEIAIRQNMSGLITVEYDTGKFTLQTIDSSAIRTSPRIPSLNLPVVEIIDCDILKAALRGIKIMGERVKVVTKGNIINLMSDTDNSSEFCEFPIFISSNYTESFSAMYSMEYLKIINSFEGNITFKYNKDMPCIIEYAKEGLEIMYMCAPRVGMD